MPPDQDFAAGLDAEKEAPDSSRYRQVRFQLPAGCDRDSARTPRRVRTADPERPFPMVDGRGDPALSPLGRQQALRVADRLAKTRVDAIYVTNSAPDCRDSSSTCRAARPRADGRGRPGRGEPRRVGRRHLPPTRGGR